MGFSGVSLRTYSGAPGYSLDPEKYLESTSQGQAYYNSDSFKGSLESAHTLEQYNWWY